MSQNITLLGASYSAVPAVRLPKTGGGTADFTDVSDTTAVAADVVTGKYFYTNAGVKVQGSASLDNTFFVTLSWDSNDEMWIPQETYADIAAAYSSGKDIVAVVDDPNWYSFGTRCEFSDNQFTYIVGYNDMEGEDYIFVDVCYYTSEELFLNNRAYLIDKNFQTFSKYYTPTTSEQTETITFQYPYNGIEEVNVTVRAVATGTAGTPTASKGIVSSHSVSVTPSVTNTTGYITGGTKTGTAVTVTASELVSGDKSITANGNNIDVTNYATVSVTVPFVTYYTGNSAPSSLLGSDGDIYLQT